VDIDQINIPAACAKVPAGHVLTIFWEKIKRQHHIFDLGNFGMAIAAPLSRKNAPASALPQNEMAP